MAKLQQFLSPTIHKIYEQREKTQTHLFLETLPTSMTGDSCLRAMWYDFRFCDQLGMDGIQLRRTELESSIKAMVMKELSSIGCVISEIDKRTGRKWMVSEYAGHLTGELDGIIESGVIESPNKPHVLKIASINEKLFNQVKLAGVEKVLPHVFAEVQTSLFLIDIERSFVVIHCADNSELFAERIKLNSEQAKFFIDRSGSVIASDNPPVKLNENRNSAQCSACIFKGICHDGYMVKPTCRNCVHSTCEREKGGWSCSKWNCDIPIEGQITGCDSHLYNPAFMSKWSVVDANDSEQWVKYSLDGEKELTNAVDKKHGYTSKHLYNCPPELIDDDNIFEIMTRFDAVVEGK